MQKKRQQRSTSPIGEPRSKADIGRHRHIDYSTIAALSFMSLVFFYVMFISDFRSSTPQFEVESIPETKAAPIIPSEKLTVQFRTEYGDVVVNLRMDQAPLTVREGIDNNFYFFLF